MDPLTQARQAIETIAQVLDDIPDARLLVYGPRQATTESGGSPEPGLLPHGLDKVTDNWETGTVRTREGILELVTEVADEWGEHLHQKPAPGARVLAWLHTTAPRACATLDDDTITASLDTLNTARRHALHLTGHTPIPAGLSCPSCGHNLTRTPTNQGLSDELNCHTCPTTWTARQYLEAVRDLANPPTENDLPPTFLTTVTRAALILDIPRPTAYGRLHTRQHRGEPTGETVLNGRHLYWLKTFQPLQ